MNNKYVNASTCLLSFRLRTARHKKRMQYNDRDKQLLALDRQRAALSKQWRSLGWVDLHPPVVRGWKRYFVLRKDIAQSSEAVFFQTLLNKINTTQYSHRKDFTIKKRSAGKKLYVSKAQQLLAPNAHLFHKLCFSKLEQRYFEEQWLLNKYTGKKEKCFVFLQPWRFELRVRPHVICKTRVRSQEIESRIQQITNHLERNALHRRLCHLSGGYRYSWKEERKKEKNPLKNKSLSAILDACYSTAENTC